ncbi:hypothetical protein ALC53_04406 [Atta colombica]|uniref:Uncharacterized protein n=1 Tax=Atta colombica TaxID=520822 RepID=A0A195BKF6_9HYME|nr:hypothetical protein ALC53_04406 [Atta colombica]
MKYNAVSFLTSMISIPGFRRYRRFATVMRRYLISEADKASRTYHSNVQQFGRVCREDKFPVIVSSWDRPKKSPLSQNIVGKIIAVELDSFATHKRYGSCRHVNVDTAVINSMKYLHVFGNIERHV